MRGEIKIIDIGTSNKQISYIANKAGYEETLKHGYYHSHDEEEASEADNKRKIELNLLKQLTNMVIEKGDKADPNRSFRPYREAVAYKEAWYDMFSMLQREITKRT